MFLDYSGLASFQWQSIQMRNINNTHTLKFHVQEHVNILHKTNTNYEQQKTQNSSINIFANN